MSPVRFRKPKPVPPSRRRQCPECGHFTAIFTGDQVNELDQVTDLAHLGQPRPVLFCLSIVCDPDGRNWQLLRSLIDRLAA